MSSKPKKAFRKILSILDVEDTLSTKMLSEVESEASEAETFAENVICTSLMGVAVLSAHTAREKMRLLVSSREGTLQEIRSLLELTSTALTVVKLLAPSESHDYLLVSDDTPDQPN